MSVPGIFSAPDSPAGAAGSGDDPEVALLLPDGACSVDESEVSPAPDEPGAALPPEVSGAVEEAAGCSVPVAPDSVDDPEAALPPEVSASVDDPDIPPVPDAPCPVAGSVGAVPLPDVSEAPDAFGAPVESAGWPLPDAPDSVPVPGVVPAASGEVPGAVAELDVSGAPGAACPEVELSAPLLVPGVDMELSCPPEVGACSCLSHANSTGKSKKRRVCRFMMVTI